MNSVQPKPIIETPPLQPEQGRAPLTLVAPVEARASIFSPALERWMVFLPIALLALLPIEYFSGVRVTADMKTWGRFITDALLLGTIHSVLSFTMMWYLPEMRAWAKDMGGGSAWRFWRHVLLAGAGIGTFFWFSITREKTDPKLLLLAYYLIDQSLGLRHWVQQTKGMSLSYNQRLRASGRLSESDRSALARSEAREKFLFTAICYLTIGTALAVSGKLIARWLFGSFDTSILVALTLGLSVASAVGLVVNAWTLPGVERTYKVAYLGRVLFIPFHSLSLIGNLIMRATHGLEFLALTCKMTKNSSLTRARVQQFAFVTLAVVLFAGLCTVVKGDIFGRAMKQDSSLKWVQVLLLTLNATFTYTHYYTDALMFRFRQKPCRDHISPLLK